MGRQNPALNDFSQINSKYRRQKCVAHLFIFHQLFKTEIYFWLH